MDGVDDARSRRRLVAIVGFAFLLRFAVALVRGPDFIEQGYSFYASIAHTFLSGGGFCDAPGDGCAIRMPLYPLLVAPFLAAGVEYPWLVLFQAAIGAAIPALLFATAVQLFDRRVGLLAALVAAVSPYAVVHDAAFQETVVLNALVLLAALLLIRATAARRLGLAVAAGVALSLAVLTTARIAPLVGLAILWTVFGEGLPDRSRRRLAVAVAAPVLVLVGLWVARNCVVVGAPVLTTESGLSLWIAHNESTMAIYPNRSIDQVEAAAWPDVEPAIRDRIEAAAGDPVRQDRAYAALAWSYVRDHPGRVAADALYRAAHSFSGLLSPGHDWPVQATYLAFALPLNVLAIIGLLRAIRADRTHLLMLLVFASVAITAAVFWAHTSHQSYLHPFTILYASSNGRMPLETAGASTSAAARRRGSP